MSNERAYPGAYLGKRQRAGSQSSPPGKRKKKLSQEKVHYRFAVHPLTSCAACVMFVPGQPCHCTDVADPIYATGVCDIWAPKDGNT